MASDRVIVFSSHTIYTEGVVNRLRQHTNSADIHFIDVTDDDFMPKVVKLRPSVVIIDQIENEETDCCLLCDLLNTFMELTIIQLKVHKQDVQVITSSPHVLESAQDLINLIGSQYRN